MKIKFKKYFWCVSETSNLGTIIEQQGVQFNSTQALLADGTTVDIKDIEDFVHNSYGIPKKYKENNNMIPIDDYFTNYTKVSIKEIMSLPKKDAKIEIKDLMK